jgi:hypothetical protein
MATARRVRLRLERGGGGGECECGEGVVPALLASFPYGLAPDASDEASLAFDLHSKEEEGGGSKNKRRKKKLLVVGGNERVDYWGKPNEALDYCRYYVGLRDPNSEEVVLYPTTQPITMRQQVSAGPVEGDEQMADQEMTAAQRRTTLVNEFGSKKKRAAVKSVESNTIRSESVAGGRALLGALKKSLDKKPAASATGSRKPGLKDAADIAADEARRAFLPRYDQAAECAAEVYDLSSIVSAEAEEAVLREARAATTEDAAEEWAQASAHVRQRLPTRPDLGDEAARQQFARLLFLSYMVSFSKTRASIRDIHKDCKDCGIPEFILRGLLISFSQVDTSGAGGDKPVHIRTNALKDRLHVHTLCLALILEGCRLDFTTLAKDLGISPQHAGKLLKELGCQVKGGVATLSVPVEFPRRRMAR